MDMRERKERAMEKTHFCKNFDNFIFCILEHLFSFTLKLISVDIFRFCSIKKSRSFKDENQFQVLSTLLNPTPEIQGLIQDAY